MKPGGLIYPLIYKKFNSRQNIKVHHHKSRNDYLTHNYYVSCVKTGIMIIPVLKHLELCRSCLTLYPFTPPGGALQVTNTDVTTCPESATSCGTSGTADGKQALILWRDCCSKDRFEPPTLSDMTETKPRLEQLQTGKSLFSLSRTSVVKDVYFLGIYLTLCTYLTY